MAISELQNTERNIVDIPCSWTQRKFLFYVLVDKVIEAIGFGGARAGGKTFISCLAIVLRAIMYANTRHLMIRGFALKLHKNRSVLRQLVQF